MKGKLYLYVLTVAVSIQHLQAQTLEWSHVFDTHSAGFGVGLYPNSSIDNSGTITTTIIEKDTLKLYQTLGDGTIANSYITEKTIVDNHTPLIRTAENGLALVYRSNPYPGFHWLLHTDSNLTVIEEVQLEIPSLTSTPKVLNLIEYNDNFYLTATSNWNHYLLKINTDNSVSIMYNGSIDIAYGEDYTLPGNGNIIFSYKKDNGHMIRCVSIENGTLIWEQSIGTGFGFPLEYKVVNNGNTLYALGIERAWIDGIGHDQVTISRMDASSGEILFQQPLTLPPMCSNCTVQVNDFVYNATNDRLYLSYSSAFPEVAVLLLEIDSQSAEITGERYFPFEIEPEFFFFSDQRSVIHIRPDGSLVMLYKSYKNELEQMNLYITPLNSQLESLGTFEFHIEELESIEHPSEVLNYDDSRILITGVVPNKNPSISLEKAEYFTAMIRLDGVLSLENPASDSEQVTLYPNPADDRVSFIVTDDALELMIVDVSGKAIHKEKTTRKTFDLDISAYQAGVYFVNLSGHRKNYTKKLIVR